MGLQVSQWSYRLQWYSWYTGTRQFQYQIENCQASNHGYVLRKAMIGCMVVFFLVLKLGDISEKITLFKCTLYWCVCVRLYVIGRSPLGRWIGDI